MKPAYCSSSPLYTSVAAIDKQVNLLVSDSLDKQVGFRTKKLGMHEIKTLWRKWLGSHNYPR